MKKKRIQHFLLSGALLFLTLCGCGMSDDAGMSPTEFESGLRKNCSLESIDFSTPVMLSSEFDPELLDYSTYVYRSIGEIGITPRAIDRFSIIKVNEYTVKSGEESALIPLDQDNTGYITISVTAETGEEKLYRLGFFRSAKSDITTLSALTINTGELLPTFEASKDGPWEVTLPTSQASIVVNAIAEDTGCRFVTIDNTKIEGSTAEKEVFLEPGKTKVIIIKIDAEEETVSTNYVIKATRAAYEPSSSTDLKNILITTSNGSELINLSPVPTDSDISVVIPWNCEDIIITPTPADPPVDKGLPTISIDSTTSPLSASVTRGEIKSVTIAVLAEDGVSEHTYTLNISRAVGQDTSLNNFTVNSDRHVTASWFSVDGDGPWYTLLRYNVGSYKILASASDPLATISLRYQGGGTSPWPMESLITSQLVQQQLIPLR